MKIQEQDDIDLTQIPTWRQKNIVQILQGYHCNQYWLEHLMMVTLFDGIPGFEFRFWRCECKTNSETHETVRLAWRHCLPLQQFADDNFVIKYNKILPQLLSDMKKKTLEIFNNQMYSKDWLSLNFQQTFNAQNNTINIVDTSRLKIGKNIAINRLKIINGKILYDWLNLSWDTFKVKCKNLLL